MSDIDAIYEGIREYADYAGPVRESCDVVIVGSGPTGAVAAYNLAEMGLDVILLEAGPVRRPRDFTTDGARTLAEVCYEGGLRAMQGKTFLPTMQARVLGGGSHINSAICVRTPQFCFDDWKRSYGVDTINREVLEPHYDRVEDFLGVEPTREEFLGRKNTLFREACDAVGLSSEPMRRNVVGCNGCAECFTGCPDRSKKSMEVSYIPAAVKKGLRVMTSIQVEQLLHNGRAATGIKGSVVEPKTNRASYPVEIKAKATILAAGCLATPVILQKSNAPDPAQLIGRDLQAHPGAALMGVFPDPVDPWFGATQGYQSLARLERGYKLEVLWAPPALLAVRLPGFGAELKEHLNQLRYSAFWDAFFALKHSKGSVRAKKGKSMNPSVKYHISPADMPQIKEGLVTLAELFFAAGATKIIPGIYGVPPVMEARDGVDVLRNADLRPEHVVLAATHLFSSTRMGPDAGNSVVDEAGQMHQLKDCYILDTGIMPRSPAVNPMLTGMAMADRMAQEIGRRYS